MGFGTAGFYRRMSERTDEMIRKNREWFEKQRQEQEKNQEPPKQPQPKPDKEDVK